MVTAGTEVHPSQSKERNDSCTYFTTSFSINISYDGVISHIKRKMCEAKNGKFCHSFQGTNFRKEFRSYGIITSAGGQFGLYLSFEGMRRTIMPKEKANSAR
jgi:hypothetical protein